MALTRLKWPQSRFGAILGASQFEVVKQRHFYSLLDVQMVDTISSYNTQSNFVEQFQYCAIVTVQGGGPFGYCKAQK